MSQKGDVISLQIQADTSIIREQLQAKKVIGNNANLT